MGVCVHVCVICMQAHVGLSAVVFRIVLAHPIKYTHTQTHIHRYLDAKHMSCADDNDCGGGGTREQSPVLFRFLFFFVLCIIDYWVVGTHGRAHARHIGDNRPAHTGERTRTRICHLFNN